ncbi:unnamed protein product [Diplocarpon coronariae]|uniref:SET domain-containing protein n=1 Tax=Diplocarpon coronariae TaxID=2795749 RepID=A0A218ZDY7_9HELO|nr:hypothetical protein B2J93_4917 [Marssonina coronariae]
MDKSWGSNLYKPSSMAHSAPGFQISHKKAATFQQKIIRATKRIKDTPYLHFIWWERGAFLSQLGFPELAASDAYKAIMLCNAGLDFSSPLGTIVRFTTAMYAVSNTDGLTMETNGKIIRQVVEENLLTIRRSSYGMLINSMMDLFAYTDAIKTCIEARNLYPTGGEIFEERKLKAKEQVQRIAKAYADRGVSFEEQKQNLVAGICRVRLYPWLPKKQRVRDKALISVASNGLRKSSNSLEIRPSAVGGSIRNLAQPDCFGIFATKRIPKGYPFLKQTHPFAISLEQSESQCGNCFHSLADCSSIHVLQCCSIYRYCSTKCAKAALDNYHHAICGKDFSEIINRAHNSYGGKSEGSGYPGGETEMGHFTGWNDRATDFMTLDPHFPYAEQVPVILIRYLAMAIQYGGDPLDHPHIASLVANDTATGIVSWSFNGMVTGPIKALEIIGIDVFADHRFDTWALLTMWYRIQNNSAALEVGFPNSVMSPTYSWFNHSCSPNAANISTELQMACDTETVSLKTIQKGEEVFVSYLSDRDLKMDRRYRQQRLKSWFGSDCQCPRCQKET